MLVGPPRRRLRVDVDVTGALRRAEQTVAVADHHGVAGDAHGAGLERARRAVARAEPRRLRDVEPAPGGLDEDVSRRAVGAADAAMKAPGDDRVAVDRYIHAQL